MTTYRYIPDNDPEQTEREIEYIYELMAEDTARGQTCREIVAQRVAGDMNASIIEGMIFDTVTGYTGDRETFPEFLECEIIANLGQIQEDFKRRGIYE